MVPFVLLGMKLTEKQLTDLISKGKTGKMKGLLIPGSHQVIEGSIALDESFNNTVL